MGSGMAHRLIAAGHQLNVYNRTIEKAKPFGERGARVATSPREAATGVDVLVTMLADDAAVEGVVLGEDGVLGALPRGSVHLSGSTISPALSSRLAQVHRDAGQRYVASPVLGRPEVAEHGELVLVVAGAEECGGTLSPLLRALRKETHVIVASPA